MSERSNIEKEMDQKILQVMVNFYREKQRKVRVEDVLIKFDIHVKYQCFHNRWTHLKKSGYIGWSKKYNGYRLSKAGIYMAASLIDRIQVKNFWGHERIIPPKSINSYQSLAKPGTVPMIFDYNYILKRHASFLKTLFATATSVISRDMDLSLPPEQKAEQQQLIAEIMKDLNDHHENLSSMMNESAPAPMDSDNEAAVRLIMDEIMYDSE